MNRPVSLYPEEECTIFVKNTEISLKNTERFGCFEQFFCKKQHWIENMVSNDAYHDICSKHQPLELEKLSQESLIISGNLKKV